MSNKFLVLAVLGTGIFTLGASASAEEVRGRVTSVNADANTITVTPIEPKEDLPSTLNLTIQETGYLKGVQSLDDLKVGDVVMVEADQIGQGRYEVKSLERADEDLIGQDLDLGTKASLYDWKDKFRRGFVNIISSPVEIARGIHVASDKENLAYGWTVGLLQGTGQGILRLGAGIVELVTFPFDFPKGNKAPLIEPEYVWEKPGVKYISSVDGSGNQINTDNKI